MAQNIIFISTQYIKDNTTINGNVDEDILKPIIIQSQDKYIEPILGTDLYNKLKTDIGAGTITGVYKTLLDEYVQKTLAHWSLYEALPFLNYKLTNKSVLTKDSENSTATGLEEIKYLRQGIRDTAEYFSQRVTNYLIANQSSFTEYNSNSDLDDIRPNSTSYFSGLYLGGGSNDCNWGTDLPI